MTELDKLIKKYGQADALVDHWDETSRRYAIWEFDEEFLINNNGVAILNGMPINGMPMQIWQDTLDKWKRDEAELTAVGYISYDLKNILFPHINFKRQEKIEPLLWFGKPRKIIPYKMIGPNPKKIKLEIKLQHDFPYPQE